MARAAQWLKVLYNIHIRAGSITCIGLTKSSIPLVSANWYVPELSGRIAAPT